VILDLPRFVIAERASQIALHNQGVRVNVFERQNIKAQATAAYLEIKRRQLL
jgi:hypothetical protein